MQQLNNIMKAFNTINQQDLFQESIDQLSNKPNESLKIQDFLSIPPQPSISKQKKNRKNQKNLKPNDQSNPKQQNSLQNRDSSPYCPEQSISLNSRQSKKHSKIDNETSKKIGLLIRQYEEQLNDEQNKQKRMRQLSQELNVSYDKIRRKVYDYLRRRKNAMTIFKQKNNENQTIYKKTQMFDQAIKYIIRKTPYACINVLKQQIKQKLNLDLAKQTLIRRLKHRNYTYIKFELKKQNKNNEQTKICRNAFFKMYNEIKLKYPILFYGYTHLSVDQCKSSMWMKKNEQKQIQHTLYQNQILNINLIISQQKIQYFKVVKGFYSNQIFNNFMLQYIDELNQKKHHDYRPVFIAKQANLIHYPEIENLENQNNKFADQGIYVVDYPMYSMKFNPIQLVFRNIKFNSRSKPKTKQFSQMVDVLKHIIKAVKTEDIIFSYQDFYSQLQKTKQQNK